MTKSKIIRKFKAEIKRVPLTKVIAIAQYKQNQINKKKEENKPISIKEKINEPAVNETTLKPIISEMSQLLKEEQELKQELNALHDVNTSLIWLLNKATMIETNRNHRG